MMASDTKEFHSQHLELLMKWGEHHLLQPGKNGLLQDLAKTWKTLDSPSDFLDSDLEILEKKVMLALEQLNRLTSDIHRDEEPEIQSALRILDGIIFLVESLECFPGSADFPEHFQRKAEEVLHKITIDQETLPLRLIPLNHWRREMLETIPPDAHYLFPWYCEWADLPENLFDLLADHWEDILRGEASALGLDIATLNALLAALQTDPLLLCRIQQDADLLRLLPHAIRESLSLRLFAISETERANITGSNTLGKKDIHAACLTLTAPIFSEAERIGRLFLAAFCSPFPDDRQRLDLLSIVEDFLKQPDCAHTDGIIGKLCQWHEGRMSDGKLSRVAFKQWGKNLARARKRSPKAITYPASSFWDAIETLRRAGISARKERMFSQICQKISELASALFSPKIIAATATACLVIFITIYTRQDYEQLQQVPPAPLKSEDAVEKAAVPESQSLRREVKKKDAMSLPGKAERMERFSPAPVSEQTEPEPALAPAPAVPEKQKSLPSETKRTQRKVRNIKSPTVSEGKEEDADQAELRIPDEKAAPLAPLPATEFKPKTQFHDPDSVARESLHFKTRLDKIDLDHLKLVAILGSDAGRSAVLEDAYGNEYTVVRGMALGRNSGHVKEILSDRIIVEEKIETASGEIMTRRRELWLQKSSD